jgi:hypothetical protein
MVAQPARHKGLGLRRIGGFVGSAAYVGGMKLASRRLIDKRGEDVSVQAGLYPLLEPFFGAGSQDHGNEDQRFAKFTEAFESLKALCPEAEAELSMPAAAIRPGSNIDPKLQRDIMKQIEDIRAKAFFAASQEPSQN